MTYDDEDTERFMQQWVEKEIRALVGPSPCCAVQDDEDDGDYDPTGPNAWFGYAVAEVVHLFVMRRMSTTWRDRPPYPAWKEHAPALRQHADELTRSAQLPPGTTLAQWCSANEPLLQQEPVSLERSRVVAAALLPLFEAEPACWAAIHFLDDDTHGTFAGYLEGWHARVPEKLRPFVRRIAREFGVVIEDKTGIGKR